MQSFGFLAIVKAVLYHVYGESANIISMQNAIFMHLSKFEKTQVKVNSPVSPCLAGLTLIPAEKRKKALKLILIGFWILSTSLIFTFSKA